MIPTWTKWLVTRPSCRRSTDARQWEWAFPKATRKILTGWRRDILVPHVKASRRAAQDRGTSSSLQPLAPTSRRVSQQQQASGGLTAPHPYATAPSPTGYRSASNGAYGRHSPNLPGVAVNGSAHQPNNINGSESFLYSGQAQPGKAATNSGEGTATRDRDMMGTPRGMAMYDREQMQRVGEQPDEGGHGGNGFFSSFFCCR